MEPLFKGITDHEITDSQLKRSLEYNYDRLWQIMKQGETSNEQFEKVTKARSAIRRLAYFLVDAERRLIELSDVDGDANILESVESQVGGNLKEMLQSHFGEVVGCVQSDRTPVELDQEEFLNLLARMFMMMRGYISEDVPPSESQNPQVQFFWEMAYQAFCAFKGCPPEMNEPMGFHGFTDPERQVEAGFRFF